MAYQRNDVDCDPVDPQPGSSTVNQFSGSEGWTTVTYKNWNADFQARSVNNSTRTPGTFQARTADNSTRSPAAYQRHDVDNNTVSG